MEFNFFVPKARIILAYSITQQVGNSFSKPKKRFKKRQSTEVHPLSAAGEERVDKRSDVGPKDFGG
jgi:hypothetical protein